MIQVTPPPLPGDQVGPYLLGPLVGVGGNATVYQASSDATLLAAIKILHPGKADTDEARRFQREFQTLQQLHHNSIVQVYESGLHGDYPWIAMEFVDGIALNTQIEQWTENPSIERFSKVESIFRELCEALSYVHKRGMIHRDIKPSNVLLTRAGRPKLTDFGVVKAPGRFDTQLTVAGRLVGTVAFMAPEQIMGDPIDARADLYSLGAVLYLMLTLKKPIEADSIPGYLARHLTHTPDAPSEIVQGIPPHLERICAKLLMKDPSQRYASAEQLLAALDEAVPETQVPFYGREKLLIGLLFRLDELVDGGGGVAVISGPDGIGKTSLLENLLIRGRGAGHDLVFVSGSDANPFQDVRERLRPRDLAGTLSSESAISPPWTLIVDDLDGLSGEDILFLTEGVRDLVAIEGEPILVIVSTPIMDASMAMSSAMGAFCSGTSTGLSAEHVVLQGLERPATVALVRGQGLVGAAGSVLGNRLFDDCNGHPGETIDQVSALLQAGWLKQLENGTIVAVRDVEDLRQSVLPVSAKQRARIVQHLSRLSDDARLILNVMVVLEMEATPNLLGQLSDLSNERVIQACRALHSTMLPCRHGLCQS